MKKLFYFLAGSCLLTACDKLVADTQALGIYTAVPDPFKVSVEDAYRMVANYAPRAGYVVHDGDSLPNTRAVWFSAERLKFILEQLEIDGGDGIRMYFAAYDDSYDGGPGTGAPPPAFWGHNTLLLVPTRDSVAGGTTYHRDYFFAGGSGLSVPMSAAMLAAPSEIENRGNVCPPLCNDDPTLLQPPPSP
ncbi:hypothetical protein ACFOET_11495 [Parapedobacter deserti]|uniref:DUF4136 domain-containing protein n=1 Tax=Parapedobacter deserti TaxID=1912957 RepID=A0ABV7JN13_9SPHI